ncbi:hypothetical protein [Anaerovibrio slackiae]|uniref:hypothetical protein n=1 Tax=Anaerovibrio slackiae TaxID=2652309 RepID=UPI00386EA92E
MKFSTYTPAVKPNTINARVNTSFSAGAFGTGGKELGALANSLSQIAGVIQKRQDESDAADIMAARTEITQRMNESLYSGNGIITTGKGKNAEGMANRIGESIQDITDDVASKYNGRVRYQLTKKYLPQDMESYGKMGMQAENRELESYRANEYKSSIASQIDFIGLNYASPDMVQAKFKEADETINTWAMSQGWDGRTTEQAKTDFRTKAAVSMVNACMSNEDSDGAEKILKENRKYMDPDTYYSLYGNIRKSQRQKEDYALGEDLYKKYWNPSTHTFDNAGFKKELESLYGRGSITTTGGMDIEAADKEIMNNSGLIGARMPNGANGCVEAYVRLGAWVSPWLKGQQGQTNVDNIMSAAQTENGGPGVIPYNASDVQYGDGIVYVDGNGETQHIVMAAGKGEGDYSYIGNSTSQMQIVRGSDYRQMGRLHPGFIIKSGPAQGTTKSNFNPERMAAITRYAESFVADEIKAWNQQQGQLSNDFLKRIINGDTGAGIQQEIINSALDADKQAALLSRIRTENKRLVSGSTGGTTSKSFLKEVKSAKKKLARYQAYLDQDKTPPVSVQIDADEASAFLIENGLAEGGANLGGEEAAQTWHYITSMLAKGASTADIRNTLIEGGSSESMADWYINQIDESYDTDE